MERERLRRWLAFLGATAVLAGFVIAFATAVTSRAQARPGSRLVDAPAGLDDLAEDDILFRETDSVKVPLAPGEELHAVCLLPDGGWAASGGQRLFMYGPDRAPGRIFETGEPVYALAAGTGTDGVRFYGACRDRVVVFGPDGTRLDEWAPLGERARLASIVYSAKDGLVYAADSGHRQIAAFDRGGRLVRFIALRTADGLGFIVPGAAFDIAAGADGALWAVDPGRRRVVRIDARGEVVREWGKTGTAPGEFYGCCNPAHIALLPDGGFAAQEKGLRRVTLFDPSGRFSGVAVGPESFHESNTLLDLAIAPDGTIYIADPFQKAIRVFTRPGAGS